MNEQEQRERLSKLDAKIAETKKRLEQIKAKRQQVEARLAKIERAKDTRRKILLGALLMAESKKNPAAQKMMQELISKLTREDDKALFT